MNRIMETRKKIVLSVALATFIFTGCSVKPEAIKPEIIKKDATKTMSVLNKTIQAVTKPISLDEAIQRAIDHNLNRRVDILNIALAEQKLDVIAYEALPKLTTQAGYKGRDSYAASQSVSYDPLSDTTTTSTTGDYSVSSNKKDDISAGIGFSWNILDFGVSYVRANQQANRFLMEKEKERKSIYNIKQEIRSAYYKAVSADELLKRLTPIMEETKKAFKDSKKIRKLRLDSPIKSLTYQRELLEVIRSLNTLEASLNQSKIRLSQLMGLKPGTNFELAEKIKDKYNLPNVNISLQELEKLALENRPELNESRYQIKISQDEVKASMLKMLPGISLNLGYDYSNSDYLANNQWTSYGASISYNLLNVFNAPIHRKYAKTQVKLAKQQKLALSMAVVSQVHLSMIELAQAKKEYELSEEYFGVAKEIYNIIENENTLDVNGKLSLIKEKLNFLISNLRLSSSYANVQNAYGKVITSIGNEKIFEEKPAVDTKKEIKPKIAIVNEEQKTEPVIKIEEIKTPTIEITNFAKLVNKAGGDYQTIEMIGIGEELQYKRKIIRNGNVWYEIKGGGYIHSSKAKEIK
jgi:outer membrane protein TolC